MSSPTLLITRSVEEADREIIEDELPTGIQLEYLDDIEPERRLVVITEADGFLSHKPHDELTAEEFEQLTSDQVVQAVSAGIDFLPLDEFPDDFILQNNAGAHAEQIAEHVLAMYAALSKRLREEHLNLQNGEFNQWSPTNKWINGSTCCIFGFGGIGQATGRILRAVGVSIHAINRSGETTEPVEFIGTPKALETVLPESNGLVISAPLTPETRGIIDRETLKLMPDDGILINVGRGELVVQQDLYEHLEANPKFSAGIDAWWTEPVRHGTFEMQYPFLDLPNVIGSPHNAPRVPSNSEQVLRAAIQNISQTLLTGEPTNVVDLDLGY